MADRQKTATARSELADFAANVKHCSGNRLHYEVVDKNQQNVPKLAYRLESSELMLFLFFVGELFEIPGLAR